MVLSDYPFIFFRSYFLSSLSSVLVFFAFYATNSLSFSLNLTLTLPPNCLLGIPWPLIPQADFQYIYLINNYSLNSPRFLSDIYQVIFWRFRQSPQSYISFLSTIQNFTTTPTAQQVSQKNIIQKKIQIAYRTSYKGHIGSYNPPEEHWESSGGILNNLSKSN